MQTPRPSVSALPLPPLHQHRLSQALAEVVERPPGQLDWKLQAGNPRGPTLSRLSLPRTTQFCQLTRGPSPQVSGSRAAGLGGWRAGALSTVQVTG